MSLLCNVRKAHFVCVCAKVSIKLTDQLYYHVICVEKAKQSNDHIEHSVGLKFQIQLHIIFVLFSGSISIALSETFWGVMVIFEIGPKVLRSNRKVQSQQFNI